MFNHIAYLSEYSKKPESDSSTKGIFEQNLQNCSDALNCVHGSRLIRVLARTLLILIILICILFFFLFSIFRACLDFCFELWRLMHIFI